MDLVRDHDAEPVEPRASTTQEPVRLLARRDQHVERLELLGGQVEVADRDSDLEPQRFESAEFLRLLLGERTEGNEVESGTAGARGSQEGEVGHERLSARGRAREQQALAREDRAEGRGLGREQSGDPVRLEDPFQLGVEGRGIEGNQLVARRRLHRGRRPRTRMGRHGRVEVAPLLSVWRVPGGEQAAT